MRRRLPLTYPERPFHHLLAEASALAPEETALRYGAASYTFRELDGAANALANALVSLGLRPGQRVALLLSNRPEAIIALFAVTKAGGAAVMMNPRWRAGEIRHALDLTRPAVVVAGAEDAVRVGEIYPAPIGICADTEPVTGWRGLWDLVHRHPGSPPEVAVGRWGDLEAVLPFSSGTTGLPKAVVHTHRSIVAAYIQWKAAAVMRSDDRPLLFLPIFHVYGVITVAASLASRATLRLFERFDVDAMLGCVRDERITMSFGAAPVALAMAEHARLEDYDLSSLRYFVWGATPMDERVAREVTRRSGVRWLHAYGATEAPLLHCNPVDAPDQWRLDSPGLPVSDLEVKVVDVATRAEVAAGESGEILVRGPQVFRGYVPPEADADAFDDGWLRTGDIGWVEPDGWIHIVDRAKEMIKVNAFQVAPGELERVLLSHPAVADCAVFGVPHDRTGEVPVAAVVLHAAGGASAEELVGWVAERVASYKQIGAIRFRSEIPRTTSGKILRRELRDRELRDRDRGGRAKADT